MPVMPNESVGDAIQAGYCQFMCLDLPYESMKTTMRHRLATALFCLVFGVQAWLIPAVGVASVFGSGVGSQAPQSPEIGCSRTADPASTATYPPLDARPLRLHASNVDPAALTGSGMSFRPETVLMLQGLSRPANGPAEACRPPIVPVSSSTPDLPLFLRLVTLLI